METKLIKTTVPAANNVSPHESKPIEAREPFFYDLAQKLAGKITVCDLNLLNKLYDAWKMGCDTRESAYIAGVSYPELMLWLKDYPELKEIYESVRTHPRTLAKRNVIRRLSNDPTAEFSLKYLEKVKPEEFGGKGAVININNTNVSVSEKSSSLTDFMSQFGGDIIDG